MDCVVYIDLPLGVTTSEGTLSGNSSTIDAHVGEAPVSSRLYVAIAVILAVFTALEVMVFYVEALAPFLLPLLMVLMFVKFALVVMFFMHLRFDRPLLTGVFAGGLFMALFIILALMAIFGKFAG